MDRREFLRSAGGLIIIASLAGTAGTLFSCSPRVPSNPQLNDDRNSLLITPELMPTGKTVGPLMVAGINLVNSNTYGMFEGYYFDAHAFDVDILGVELIALADGNHTLQAIRAQVEEYLSSPLDSAELAMFYVTLGEAGYLQNKVLISLFESQA